MWIATRNSKLRKGINKKQNHKTEHQNKQIKKTRKKKKKNKKKEESQVWCLDRSRWEQKHTHTKSHSCEKLIKQGQTHTMQTSCSVPPQRCHSPRQLCYCNIPPGEESLADTLPVIPMTADSLRERTNGKLMPAFKGCCQTRVTNNAARQYCWGMCKYLQDPCLPMHIYISLAVSTVTRVRQHWVCTIQASLGWCCKAQCELIPMTAALISLICSDWVASLLYYIITEIKISCSKQ